MCKFNKMGDNHNISDKDQTEEDIGEAPDLNEQEGDISEGLSFLILRTSSSALI